MEAAFETMPGAGLGFGEAAGGSGAGEDGLGELIPPSSFVLLFDLGFAVPFTTSANLKSMRES